MAESEMAPTQPKMEAPGSVPFVIKFEGKSLPAFRPKDIAESIGLIDAFLLGDRKAQLRNDEVPPVAIRQIKSGSVEMHWELAPAVAAKVPEAVRMLQAVARGRQASVPEGDSNRIRALLNFAFRHQCRLVVAGSKRLGIRRIAVDGVESLKPKTLEMKSVLRGHVTWLCTEEPKARVRPYGEERELEIELMDALWKSIRGHDRELDFRFGGTGTWEVEETGAMRMKTFRAETMAPIKNEPIGPILESLAGTAVGRFDDIDPVEYIRRLRRGEE